MLYEPPTGTTATTRDRIDRAARTLNATVAILAFRFVVMVVEVFVVLVAVVVAPIWRYAASTQPTLPLASRTSTQFPERLITVTFCPLPSDVTTDAPRDGEL